MVSDIELQPTNLYGGNAQGLFRVDTNQRIPQVMRALHDEHKYERYYLSSYTRIANPRTTLT